MSIKQLSIFLENRLGRLNDVISILGKNKINIRAISLVDKADYGILRLIVDKKKKALKILKDNNFSVNEADIIAVEVEDKPGGLAKVLGILVERNISIEYIYTFVEKVSKKVIVVFKTENNKRAESILRKNKFKLLKENRELLKHFS
ncbi:MAG: ACT domain-containing protein [Candidatus Omnitrophica bacterium]|nr:ACT domain-containing protein [Candidatus Omnitrophota bacterium]MCM8809771.1 ACT domain-containing protein [Candidatus Omnitrophota bacterium]MCM8810720.1 ACT domain-containing protein [Candidatus Omnitrophota bacterium]